MANLRDLNELAAKLRGRAAQARRDAAVTYVVGFTANYAIWVHENLEQRLKGRPRPSGLGVYWGPAGQPKFLEGPARSMARELGLMVRQAVLAGQSLKAGLLLAALRLQREAQLRVPVEYGVLRASAFTREEKFGSPTGAGPNPGSP